MTGRTASCPSGSQRAFTFDFPTSTFATEDQKTHMAPSPTAVGQGAWHMEERRKKPGLLLVSRAPRPSCSPRVCFLSGCHPRRLEAGWALPASYLDFNRALFSVCSCHLLEQLVPLSSCVAFLSAPPCVCPSAGWTSVLLPGWAVGTLLCVLLCVDPGSWWDLEQEVTHPWLSSSSWQVSWRLAASVSLRPQPPPRATVVF